jgi:hypothetical protein
MNVLERARPKEIEREVHELRAETAFLNSADVRIMAIFA